MTPLDKSNDDTGPNDAGHEAYIAPSWDDDVQPVSLSEAASLAAGLKAAREATGRTLEDLSDATRVRKQYLIALEEGAYDRLPSRPFSTATSAPTPARSASTKRPPPIASNRNAPIRPRRSARRSAPNWTR